MWEDIKQIVTRYKADQNHYQKIITMSKNYHNKMLKDLVKTRAVLKEKLKDIYQKIPFNQ